MKIIKEFLPPILIRKLTGLFYGWSGNYETWNDAQKKAIGYDSEKILKKIENALLKVKNGEAVCERDSVLFDKIEYSFPLLSALMTVALENDKKLNVIDFGGSLGSTYFQNRLFLNSLDAVSWNIVEQSHFVEKGKELFADENLKFYFSIEDCLKENKPDIIIFSSVLQYIEKPYDLLEEVFKHKTKYIFIDRTAYFSEEEDRITLQKANPKIYNASYPCWFFNEAHFLEKFKASYDMVFDFTTSDRSNIKSVFKGFLFRLK
ncbi:MAG: TIGR04325 family methyltransferase [Bacteroidota bacterium]